MSSTSEHDPLSPPAPFEANGHHPSDGTDEDQAGNGADFADDGPLDPSAFDGLFDDLADDSPAPIDHPEPVDDNPLAEFMALPLADVVDQTDAVELDPMGDDFDQFDQFASLDDGAADPAESETVLIGGSAPAVEGVEEDGWTDAPAPVAESLVEADEQPELDVFEVPLAEPLPALEPSPLVESLPLAESLPLTDEQSIDDEQQAEYEGHDWHDDPDAGGYEGEARLPDGSFAATDDRPLVLEQAPPPLFDLPDPPAADQVAFTQAEPELDGSDVYRASPPIQRHDPEPEPAPTAPVMVPLRDEPTLAPAPGGGPDRPRRKLAALVLAVLIGGGIGAVAVALVAQLANDDPATGPAVATPIAESDDSSPSGPAAAETAPAAVDRLELTSLGFTRSETGAVILAPSPALDLLAAAIVEDPTQPVSVSVRTFTETTAAADLDLSIRQAAAVAAELVELGADPANVAVVGLGRSLLSAAQPVPNFVVASTGLEPSDLGDVAEAIGPFAIGLDRTTGQLRADSLTALDALAAAMAADQDRQLTLAGYSFDQPDSETNETQARLAVDTAVDHLAETGIDPSRLTVIVAGEDPYAVPDPVANHLDLRWGRAAAAPLALHTVGIDSIDFAQGTEQLTPESGAVVDRLGAMLVEFDAEAVIDVQSFDGADRQASVDLSVARARVVGQRLLDAGVPGQRLRLHGGASPQFGSATGSSRLVITLIEPPTRP